jgi:hypothetical protein
MFSALPREDVGCLSIHAFRPTRDARIFYIHSLLGKRSCLPESCERAAYGALRRTRRAANR